MNADRLFALYDRVAEAPDAVGRMRRFVLDLAVRGKLVEQDPSDEPATELLKRIDEGKDRLAGFNRAKKSRALPPIDPRETPFELPPTWQWVYFGNIVDFSAGRTPPRKEPSYWNTGDFPWVSIADMEDGKTVRSTKETVSTEARLNVFKREPEPPGTIIMSFKLTIGKIAKLGIPAFHNEAIISIWPHLAEFDSFLFRVLPDLARAAKAKGAIKGATLNRKSLSKIMVPLPPLPEQHRIVAKVDELFALCDHLEEVRTAREDTRDRLTKASLTRLVAPDIDAPTFRSHARFAVNALPTLTSRADQVKHLRQTILNLAVRGKLVEQDPSDEPATELLKRIDEGKDRLAGFNRAKKSRALPPIDPRETPFELPPTWQWVYFGNIVDFSAGRTPPRKEPSYWNTGDFPWVSIADMEDGKTVRSTKETVSTEARLNVFKREPEPPGTIIMSFKLTIGKIAKLGIPAFHNEAIISIWPHLAEFDSFLFRVLPDLARAAKAKGAIKGATLNRKSLSKIMVPLPPLPEQHRIVAKVDELFALCDRLEAGLDTVDGSRSRLLKSLLHDALASASHEAATARRRQG